MPGERRQLPYEALDPEWEAREFHKFRAAAGDARQQAPYGAYLFGRLMQSDLHQSCRAALPPDVAKLNGCTIQGVCILQVVDVANIGANYEHRTELSAAGPTRTLKLGLTDGHQLVFGFEFSSLPQFSVNIARGTKIVVENVPVRHGLLMLAPDNCQLLETSSDRSGQGNGQVQRPADPSVVSAGAYSAALVTTSTIPEPARSGPVPSVFVDVPSSDEDMNSDTTDPMLRVSVEDCTATKEADVAEDFVTRLMGVPCSEFLQTMKTKVQVAHGWAATMQFALMTLEGVMTFEKGAAGPRILGSYCSE
uniref:RecQ-mediated genome instability protein 1 n=1 Tax=Phytophthora ramorum TaxID=164328 RepID=H3HDE1_PHYRM